MTPSRASNKCSHPPNHASAAVTMGNESCLVGGWRQIVLDRVGVSHVNAIASTIGRGPEAYTFQPCPLGGLGGKGLTELATLRIVEIVKSLRCSVGLRATKRRQCGVGIVKHARQQLRVGRARGG